jgi:hypothetical protein
MKTLRIFLAFLVMAGGQTALLSVVAPEAALAKPPPWAPAHGYRRKHNGDTKVQGDERIHELDSNGDGVISRQEWNEGDDLFRRLDLNHDGVLSRYEISRIDLERGLVTRFLDKVKEKVMTFWSWLW